MKQMKYLLVLALTVIIFAAACGNNSSLDSNNKSSDSGSDSGKDGYKPKELTVQFVPSQNADTLEAKAKPLEKLLSKKLDIPVKVSVSTNYNTIVEAMKSKKVDVGFLPPTAYTLAHDQKAADLLLKAQRYGVNEDGSNSKKLVDDYKSEILVKKDSGIKDTTKQSFHYLTVMLMRQQYSKTHVQSLKRTNQMYLKILRLLN